jgi:hypothetical protein
MLRSLSSKAQSAWWACWRLISTLAREGTVLRRLAKPPCAPSLSVLLKSLRTTSSPAQVVRRTSRGGCANTLSAHAVVLLDRAGWHTTRKLDVPENITPIFLPSRAPELNPAENVWQYLRQNRLSNTVFENYDAIVDAACAA